MNKKLRIKNFLSSLLAPTNYHPTSSSNCFSKTQSKSVNTVASSSCPTSARLAPPSRQFLYTCRQGLTWRKPLYTCWSLCLQSSSPNSHITNLWISLNSFLLSEVHPDHPIIKRQPIASPHPAQFLTTFSSSNMPHKIPMFTGNKQ